jgi:hypothetical protein
MARTRRKANDPPEKLGGNIGMPAVGPGMNKIPDGKSSAGGTAKDKNAEDKETAVLQRARKRFDRASTYEENNRKAGLEDDKMYNGQQWPSDVAAQRNFDHRPCLTLNQFPTLVHQVTNDQRQNRPGINVSPVGDKGDPEAAKMYMGLIRFIERSSEADIAYDTAYESAVRKGWAYWRVMTEYDSPDSFDQAIVIKRIRNAYTVYMDPGAQEPEGADCRYAFVTEMIPRSEFEEEYPDANPMQWTQAGIGDALKNWIAQNEVRVAEYFEIEHEKRKLVMLENGHEGWEDELSEEAKKIPVIAQRESFEPTVHWYKMTGVEILEERKLPGKWIPIIRLIGDEMDLEGKVYYSGMIRHAHDAQRQYNYMRTSFVEAVALAPKAPYIMVEGQQESHEEQWKQANTRSYPYLLYKPVDIEGKPAPPPQRQAPVPVPAGIVEGAKEAAQDVMSITGVRFNANPQQERMYDESGRALRELRRAGDIGSFHYVDNLARALRHTGDIIIDLIPKIYERKRIMTILREDGSEQQIQIDPMAQKAMSEGKHPQTRKTMPIFNPTIGKYGVTVTVGPSYATKRIEAAESMMDFLRATLAAQPGSPAASILDLVAKNMDWPDGEQVAARLAKSIPPNLLTPEQKDVPPQVQALIQNQQQQLQQATQQLQMLAKALQDQQAERAQQQDKIDKDFEAKLLAVAQKSEAATSQHIGSQLKDLAEGVAKLHEYLASPRTANGSGAAV